MSYKYELLTGVTKVKTKLAIAFSALGVGAAGIFGAASILGTAHAVTPQVVYNSLASDSPPTNYPSQPFQAQQTNEFGDYVHLGGTARQLNTISVTMSDWAKELTPANQTFCETAGNCDSTGFFWPITVKVYANSLANDVPNNLLGTKTFTAHIPWRPESDPDCGTTSNGTGWKVDGTCFNFSGIAANISFDMTSLNLTLPNDVIVGFVYSTQTYGPNPTGVDGPYNSLNIAVPDNDPVTVGTDDSTTAVFWNTSTESYYSNDNCTGGAFCLDTNWGVNGTVAMRITATEPELPQLQGQATGGVTLTGSGAKQQLSFEVRDYGLSSVDKGSVEYSNFTAGLHYTASIVCANVGGTTAYFAYQIPSTASTAAGTWVVWKVNDTGSPGKGHDNADFSIALNQSTAVSMCETGFSPTYINTVNGGNLVVHKQ